MTEDLRLERHPIANGMFIIAAGVIESRTLQDLARTCRPHHGGRIELDLREVTCVDDAGVVFLLDLADRSVLILSGASARVAQAVSDAQRQPRQDPHIPVAAVD